MSSAAGRPAGEPVPTAAAVAVDQAKRSLGIEAVLLGLVTGPLLLCLLFATRKLEGDVAALVGASEPISRGELDHPVPIADGGEMARLGRAMEKVRATLMATRTSEAALAEAKERLVVAVEAWHETFDAFDSPMLTFDETLRVERANRAAATALGTTVREIVGVPLDELPAVQPWQTLARLVAQVVDSGEPRHEWCEAKPAPGTWDLLVHPFTRPGRRRGVVALVRDTTDIELLRDQIAKHQQQAELGHFLACVAHEVRNPLFGLAANLEAWEEISADNPEAAQFVEHARHQCDRLSRLMRDLLEFGRPKVGEQQPGDVAEVVRQALGEDTRLARRNLVALELVAGGQLPPCRIEANRLIQALTNMVDNAIAFAPEGSTVLVTVREHQDEPAVEILVEDRGPGFSEKDLAHAAEPFFTRRRGGTGLGLAITKRVAEEHRGRLVIGNRPGGGAAVSLVIPALAGATA